jgi:hydroxyisourate hydrolase
MRLLSAIDTEDAKGFLTCHVLDTANGCPGKKGLITFTKLSCRAVTSNTSEFIANKMRIMLHRVSPENSAGFVARIHHERGWSPVTKDQLFKGGEDFIVGTYVFTFFVADYFAAKGNYFTGTPFLDEIPIRFGIDNPDDHYHVPLLVSPWSFSTYRGS